MDFRKFHTLDVEFPDSNFIILLGVNGSGKTTILDGIAKSLAQVVAKLTTDDSLADDSLAFVWDKLEDTDIHNNASFSSLSLILEIFEKDEKIAFWKERNRKLLKLGGDVERLGQARAEIIYNKKNPPLIVYYRVNRSFAVDKDIVPYYSTLSKSLDGYMFSMMPIHSAFSPYENWILSQEILENEIKVDRQDLLFELPNLSITRKAITKFLSQLSGKIFTKLRGIRTATNLFDHQKKKNSGDLYIDKNDLPVKLSQLSSGERMLISLVVDMATRMAMLNDGSKDSLNGEGVVLIDELEMHLHPKWQRNLVPALKSVFPNVQFITTTHSPQIISRVSDKDILVVGDDQCYSLSTNPLGRDSNGILEEIFGTPSRPKEIDELIKKIYRSLDRKPLDNSEVETQIKELKAQVAQDDPILTRIENILKRIKILSE